MALNHVFPGTLKASLITTGEIRRIAHSEDNSGSFVHLQRSLKSFWGDYKFVVTYKDEDGDNVTVGSEAEWAEALRVANALEHRVFKLQAYPTRDRGQGSLLKALCAQQPCQRSSLLNGHLADGHTAPLVMVLPATSRISASLCPPLTCSPATAADASGVAVHPGITCDKSGMSPIVGPRYHVLGNDYDLCQAEFDTLPEAERLLFVRIEKPGGSPVPCLPQRAEAGTGASQETKEEAVQGPQHGEAKGTQSGATANQEVNPTSAVLDAQDKAPRETSRELSTSPAAAAAPKKPRSEVLSADNRSAEDDIYSSYVSVEPTTAEEEAEEEVEEPDHMAPATAGPPMNASTGTNGTTDATALIDGGKDDGDDEEADEILAELEAMGFTDRAHNRALLAMYNRRSDLVVNALLGGF